MTTSPVGVRNRWVVLMLTDDRKQRWRTGDAIAPSIPYYLTRRTFDWAFSTESVTEEQLLPVNSNGLTAKAKSINWMLFESQVKRSTSSNSQPYFHS